jgi:hypothetical protein
VISCPQVPKNLATSPLICYSVKELRHNHGARRRKQTDFVLCQKHLNVCADFHCTVHTVSEFSYVGAKLTIKQLVAFLIH